MKTKIKFGFAGREPIDDFLITPAIAFAKCNSDKGYAFSIGIKFGYWGWYVAFLRLK